MDFKANMAKEGPVVDNFQFFNKETVSCFNITVLYKEEKVDDIKTDGKKVKIKIEDQNEKDEKKYKYFDYFSEHLNHNSKFILDCLKKLLDSKFMKEKQFDDFSLWIMVLIIFEQKNFFKVYIM